MKIIWVYYITIIRRVLITLNGHICNLYVKRPKLRTQHFHGEKVQHIQEQTVTPS